MFDRDQYELIDFGQGTKVERFGGKLIARESPSVDRFRSQNPIEGFEVDASFDRRETGKTGWHGTIESAWHVTHGPFQFSLRQTPTGQVGVFPEQSLNWDWIADQAEIVDGSRAINLFGYTGGSTLALAAAGAKVTHVDSASSVVAWARENAESSNLEERPIRWIVEDAMKFVRREIKRGNTYDVFVADPPSFGRGPKNETWKIERDIETLIECAAELCPEPKMMIVSYHTPSLRRATVSSLMSERFRGKGTVSNLGLTLKTADNRILPSGDCVRFLAEA